MVFLYGITWSQFDSLELIAVNGFTIQCHHTSNLEYPTIKLTMDKMQCHKVINIQRLNI